MAAPILSINSSTVSLSPKIAVPTSSQTEAAEFEPGYSSNPEWNPGYVEEEPSQANP